MFSCDDDPACAARILPLVAETFFLVNREGICTEFFLKEEYPWFRDYFPLEGRDLPILFPEHVARSMRAAIVSALDRNRSQSGDYTLSYHGKQVVFRLDFHPYDAERVVVCYHNITVPESWPEIREKAHERTKRTEVMSYVSYWTFRPDSGILRVTGFVNDRNDDYEEYELTLEDLLEFVLPEDREAVIRFFRKEEESVRNGMIYRTLEDKGEDVIRYYQVNLLQESTDESGMRLMEGYMQNITHTMKDRRELDLIRMAMDNASEDIFAIRSDGTVICGNRSFRERNRLEGELSQYTVFDLPMNLGREWWEETIVRVLERHCSFQVDLRLDYLPGEEFSFDYTTFVSENIFGEKLLWFFCRDITPLRRMSRDLLEAKEKAEESDRLKSAFLANMSHEIRTPLNAIVGFSRVVAETEDPAERQQYISIVEKNNDRLLELINEILDLSKIEAGVIDFHLAPIAAGDVCREVCDALTLRCAPGVELVFDESEPGLQLDTDRGRLFQVLANLVGNAAKFTSEGSIRIGYRRTGDTMAEFYVADTGLGISPEQRSKLFSRFFKGNEFADGTGLGLFISRLIVGKLGGEIWAEENLPHGTVFRFTHPCLPEKLAEN